MMMYDAILCPRESQRPLSMIGMLAFDYRVPKYNDELSPRGRFRSYFQCHTRGSAFSLAPESNFHAHYFGLQIHMR